MNLQDVIVLGLVSSFNTFLITKSDAVPMWFQELRYRYYKPLACALCMSFWISLPLWLVYDYIMTAIDLLTFFQAFASMAVSLILVLVLERLNIYISK